MIQTLITILPKSPQEFTASFRPISIRQDFSPVQALQDLGAQVSSEILAYGKFAHRPIVTEFVSVWNPKRKSCISSDDAVEKIGRMRAYFNNKPHRARPASAEELIAYELRKPNDFIVIALGETLILPDTEDPQVLAITGKPENREVVPFPWKKVWKHDHCLLIVFEEILEKSP